jgi:hypothetical protein
MNRFERAMRRPGVFRRLSSFSLVEKLSDSPVRGKMRKINDLDEFLATYPEVKELIGDGSEFKIQRPKRKQGKNYTGKSKRHVKKTIIAVNRSNGLILGRTKVRPGSVHDKRVLEEDPLHRRLDARPHILKRMDSAWTGEDPGKKESLSHAGGQEGKQTSVQDSHWRRTRHPSCKGLSANGRNGSIAFKRIL